MRLSLDGTASAPYPVLKRFKWPLGPCCVGAAGLREPRAFAAQPCLRTLNPIALDRSADQNLEALLWLSASSYAHLALR